MFRFFIILFFVLSFSIEILKAGDPLENRACAYQDKGKLKLAIENFGRFGGIRQPEGLWGNFQYIVNCSFILGIPGKNQDGKPYLWALGPKLEYDVKTKKFHIVGSDTTYWGPTVSESWFDRTPNLERTDWEALQNSKITLFNPQATTGEFYGQNGLYTSADDNSPLLATSTIQESWPQIDSEYVWPGHWAIEPNDSSGTKEVVGQFVSDQDVYFEFDDRYATRDVDPGQGYPTYIRASVSSYSFSDSVAQNIIFFNMMLHNESAYNYENAYVGLYLDADIYSRLSNGAYWGRSNDDDMMGYDRNLSMAYIYDLDGDHNNPNVGNENLAYVGLKFLDTPVSSAELDLDGDGVIDIYQGDKLGLTGWHWFDWYHRPGARDIDENQGPYSGDGHTPVAKNKEEIQYKILAGDTSNLSSYDATYYFHPKRNRMINPYFDSMDALMHDYPNGLDCVFIMSTGPFNIASGDSVPFSFCLIMAPSQDDLINYAQFAQKMFENHYHVLPAVLDNQKVKLSANNFQLYQNYPNPFNGRTRIEFKIPNKAQVELNLYNNVGQKVRNLLNKLLNKGEHMLYVDAENLASGVYFYQLVVDGNIVKTKKMLLLR